MVPNNTYLLNVGEVYYFRVKVPKHIKSLYESSHIKKSLHTRNLQTALHRATVIKQLTSMIFKQMESGMVKKNMADEILNIMVKQVTPKKDELSVEYINKHTNTKLESPELNIPPAGEYGAFLELERQNKAVAKAVAEATGSVDDLMGKIEERLCNTSDLGSQSKELVKDLLEKFISIKMNDGSWDESTKNEYKPFISLFKECFGDMEVAKVTIDYITDYRDNVLQRYPKNRYRYFKDTSLKEALLDTTQPKISSKRVNYYLGFVVSFFIWCLKRGYITKNPAIDVMLKIKPSQQNRRTGYNKQELETIIVELSKLPARGKDDERRNIDRIWIVLIGLYSGFRQNEICQLFADNIFSTDGIPCMQVVNDEARQQRGKNEPSYRTIPIHKTLLQLGFLSFVNERRNSDEVFFTPRNTSPQQIQNKKGQLFQSMNPARHKNNYAKNLKNFYYGRDGNAGFNQKITTRPMVTFHSLRHNFISALKNTSKVKYAVETLAGHSHTSITSRVYTEAELASLNSELNRLKYNFNIFEIFGVEPLSDEQIAEQVKQLSVKG